MKNLNRREFMKYGVIAGASLLASNSLASTILKNDYDGFSTSVNIILNNKPTLSINIGDAKLEYPIVAGQKPNHPTPKGIFSVKKIIHKPHWYPPRNSDWVKNNKKLMAYIESTDNIDENGNVFIPHGHPIHPLGDWKIGFYENYYIHGAGDSAINRGQRYASHGCIRMRDKNIERVAKFCKKYNPLIHIS